MLRQRALAKPVTNASIGLYGVTEGSDEERKKGAHLLAKWLTGSEVGRLVPGYQMAPGLRKSNKNLEDNEHFRVVSDSVRFAVFEPPVAVPRDVWRSFLRGIRSAAAGEKTAQGAMSESAEAYKAALE